MENNVIDDLNLSVHHQIYFNDTNNSDRLRKLLVHTIKASPETLSNENVCALFESYSDKIQETNYDDKLKNLLSKSNNIVGTNFKSNLASINPQQFIKPLPCTSEPVNYCPTSENFSKSELDEFLKMMKDTKGPVNTNLTNRTVGKQILYPERKYTNTTPTEVEIKKESSFKTAREELDVQYLQKYGTTAAQTTKRKLGHRRNVNSKFVSPFLSNSESNEDINPDETLKDIDERLKHIEPKMIELIKSEIMDCNTTLHWDDIAGLTFAKTAIREAVVWPMLRPDIFTGLRRPPKGILLFGPPGTGKTLIGKCVASQSKSTFFSISASSLTSKWIGDGEKMVRALFTVARVHQPSVIFIDEVDSLLSQRSDKEHESSRRIKTEFLVQLDGATTDSDERILVIGATNRPQELDEAARRRFVKRLYIPLPEYEARLQLIRKLIVKEKHQLDDGHFALVAERSDGYSGADIKNLCSEASFEPIRSIDINMIQHIQANEVRPLLMEDFEKALTRVKSSVSPDDLEQYVSWDKIYGSGF